MRTTTRGGRLAGWLLSVILLTMTAGAMLACHSMIEPRREPARASFDRSMVERGVRLSALGGCASCHTASEAAPYAGGVALDTPFGTIFSTNITPDVKTGIGAWTEDAFRRALREGISQDGHHLYPAFPYDYTTRMTDDDIKALYAFLMTRDPIEAPARENRLKFPFGFRPLIAGWNLLYLDRSPVRPDPAQSAEWNRGAYLVQSVGHCGACHSPRNAMGAEDRRRYLGGGDAEGWYAPALNANSPSPLPWTVDQLAAYLRTGLAPDHAIAGGPMQEVVNGLAGADEKDVRAIAVYIDSALGTPSAERRARADAARARAGINLFSGLPAAGRDDEGTMQLGASVYAGACARCHDAGRQDSSGGALPLPLAIALYDPDPRNLVHIIRDGIQPPAGKTGKWMPGFADALTDEQLTALVSYLRRQGADAPPWPDVAATVQKATSP